MLQGVRWAARPPDGEGSVRVSPLALGSRPPDGEGSAQLSGGQLLGCGGRGASSPLVAAAGRGSIRLGFLGTPCQGAGGRVPYWIRPRWARHGPCSQIL